MISIDLLISCLIFIYNHYLYYTTTTLAWWINQYPALKDSTFIQKWLAGWSIAATLEYLPLIGAFTIGMY